MNQLWFDYSGKNQKLLQRNHLTFKMCMVLQKLFYVDLKFRHLG